MTRLAAIFIATFSLLGALYFALSSAGKKEEMLEAKKEEHRRRINEMGTIVYSIRDIPAGVVIRESDLELKQIDRIKIPTDAVCQSSIAVARKAKYGISQGQILFLHDLASKEIPRTHAVKSPEAISP